MSRKWLGHEYEPGPHDRCQAIVQGDMDDKLFAETHGWMMVTRARACNMPEKAHGVTPAERRLFLAIGAYFPLAIAAVVTFWLVVFS